MILPGDKLTLTDGREEYTALVTEVHQERETRLVYPTDLIPANINLPPDFDTTPEWVAGPTVTRLNITITSHQE